MSRASLINTHLKQLVNTMPGTHQVAQPIWILPGKKHLNLISIEMENGKLISNSVVNYIRLYALHSLSRLVVCAGS